VAEEEVDGGWEGDNDGAGVFFTGFFT